MVTAVLADWRTAPISEKVRATLGFLEKVTLTPAAIEPEDAAPLRALGIRDEAIEDALVVCAMFNMIDRMADSLNVTVPSAEGFSRTADTLLAHGYI